MPRLDLPVQFLRRPVKPLAFAAMWTMFVIGYINFRDIGLFKNSVSGDILAAFSVAAGVALLAGWWRRSQTMAEVGLLMASGVWFARMMLALLLPGTNPSTQYGWLFSGAWAIALLGAFLLERDDRDNWGH